MVLTRHLKQQWENLPENRRPIPGFTEAQWEWMEENREEMEGKRRKK